MDRWILSRLSSLITTVDKGLEEYHITETARMLEGFVDDLSNWYVRRCRERFWGKGMTEDKRAAFMTLYTVLVEFSKLAAPYVDVYKRQRLCWLGFGSHNFAIQVQNTYNMCRRLQAGNI